MAVMKQIIETVKSAQINEKKQYLEYILQAMERSASMFDKEDIEILKEYTSDEVEYLIAALSAAKTYREKDLLMVCEDALIGIIMHTYGKPENIPDDKKARISALVDLVQETRYLEDTMDQVFKQEKIEEAYASRIISFASECKDEYQRGRFYAGLAHYKSKLGCMTDAARKALSEYIASELKRYLSMESLSDDCIESLEFAADVCKHYATEETASLLVKVMELGYNNVNFYALGSVYALGGDAPKSVIDALANDLEYASMAYDTLKEYGKAELFPSELTDPVYLAKSDMVHWLVYPTELGKKPDAIEYLGKIKYFFKKEEYYVFKYMSDSENLGEELQNKWLIGWSNDDGGTFSNFDLLSDYEKGSVDKTLKNIKKKLIG
jgi:hypothetical protein